MRCARSIRSRATHRLRRCRRAEIPNLGVCWQHQPKDPPPIGPHYLPRLSSAIVAAACRPFIEGLR